MHPLIYKVSLQVVQADSQTGLSLGDERKRKGREGGKVRRKESKRNKREIEKEKGESGRKKRNSGPFFSTPSCSSSSIISSLCAAPSSLLILCHTGPRRPGLPSVQTLQPGRAQPQPQPQPQPCLHGPLMISHCLSTLAHFYEDIYCTGGSAAASH